MARCDFVAMVADSWRDDGPRLRPGELADWTPHQLLAVFFTRRGGSDAGAAQSDLEILAGHNAKLAAKGVRPVSPSWFLPDLTKGS